MPRDIDHLVIAVNDLEAARATWQALGFTVAPVARHPFGTANAIIQTDGERLVVAAKEKSLVARSISTKWIAQLPAAFSCHTAS